MTMNINEQFYHIMFNPSSVLDIPDPEPAVVLTAISMTPILIQYLPNPSLELQLVALEKDLTVRHVINNIHPDALEYVAIQLLKG